MTGAELIVNERKRQIEQEHYDAQHDDMLHNDGDLGVAGACYALDVCARIAKGDSEFWSDNYASQAESLWPWDKEWWKPTPQDNIRELVKAGALIAAEIDRLQRAKGK